MIGASTGFTGRTMYEEASAELQETQHQMAQAQDWETDTNKEPEDTSQEKPPTTVIMPPMDLFTRELSRLSLGSEQSAMGGATIMTAKSQMLVGTSLAKAEEGICRWTEQEAKDWPRFDRIFLVYAAWKKSLPHNSFSGNT